jgi:excisionase family DNA binding protein
MRIKSHKWRFSGKPAAFFRLAPPDLSPIVNPGRKEMTADDDCFIGAKEAAAWLGIPLRSLNQYVQQGVLPSYKLGRHRLFRKVQLLEALGVNFNNARSEIFR